MKRTLIAFQMFLIWHGFSQGLVNFNNTAATQVYIRDFSPPPQKTIPISGPPGSYYFGLFTAPVGTLAYESFTFSGLYATNLSTAGLFAGGGSVAVPGWAPGTMRRFFIAGWSAAAGHDFNPAFFSFLPPGGFGVSFVGSGVVGGFDGTSSIPSLDLFGGATGIQSGFLIDSQPLIPEPSVTGFLLMGVLQIVLSRRLKTP